MYPTHVLVVVVARVVVCCVPRCTEVVPGRDDGRWPMADS